MDYFVYRAGGIPITGAWALTEVLALLAGRGAEILSGARMVWYWIPMVFIAC
jgi:hypothetical protein